MHSIAAAELQPQREERKRPKRQLGNPPSIGFPPHEAIGLLLLQWLGKRTSLWLSTSPAPPVNYSHKLLTPEGLFAIRMQHKPVAVGCLSSPPLHLQRSPRCEPSSSGLELPARLKMWGTGHVVQEGWRMGTKGVGEARLRCTYFVHKQTTAVNVAAEMQS